MSTVVITGCSSGWVEVGTADLRGGGHRGAPKRTQACPRTRSAVRRRPSLPRPVRPGPPDRHQQRRLAPSQATPRAPAVPSPPPKTSGRSRRVMAGACRAVSGRRAVRWARRGSPRGRRPWRPRTRCRCPVPGR
ncbi:hypothetical protein GTY49_38230 [Streptomyces sp. SID5477]|nr:hypothetical protein [Streptomyces sp. SID5477]